ncbi:MAG: CDP-diacylglycerol--serine O-phosphatidyltransferase [Candidatus Latescibacteria bacterium]|nr:CDP-diacylglycerol--serine O-phosphatidyltransferase [Candidatus Latescibacterota bacterium]
MKRWARVAFPNLFTLGSIYCGVASILYSIDGFNGTAGDPARAAWLIIAASLLDAIDGKVARFSHGTSRFGVELDSLADVISFGVAPAILLYMLKPFGHWTWVPAFFFLICGTVRLARFNVLTNRRLAGLGEGRGFEKEDFLGLPIPVAAISIASYILFCWDRWEEVHLAGPFMFLVGLLSVLMVSTVPYQTLPKLAFDSVRSVLKLIVFLAAVTAVCIDPQLMSFPIVLLYVLFGVFVWLVHLVREEEEVAVPIEE